jgi:hypothetical protein
MMQRRRHMTGKTIALALALLVGATANAAAQSQRK